MSDVVEKTYSQADVDDIMDKVRKTESDKYDKLMAKFNELDSAFNKQVVKEQFIANGGNASLFEDFYSLEGGNTKSSPKYWEDVKSAKSWAFGVGQKEVDNGVINEMFGDDSDNFVGNTIYPTTAYYNKIKNKK